jgi:Protein of unknown function (DUF3102)
MTPGQANLALIPNTLFDYAALDRETEVAARSDAALIKGLMRRTAEDVVEIGSALIRQKQRLPHGMFLPWIETEFDMSQSAAYRFINVAERYSGKLPSLGSLTVEALYELSAPSTPPEVREEIERRVAAGELATAEDVRLVKAQVAEVKQNAEALARTNEQVQEQNRDLLANAHRTASEEAEKAHGAEIAELKQRIESMQAAAAASIEATAPAATNVVPLVPKTDGEPVKDADPLESIEGENPDTVDITSAVFGAHAIYTALSTIELAQTTPADFWAIFNTPHLKKNTARWLRVVSKKINAIKKGMPK